MPKNKAQEVGRPQPGRPSIRMTFHLPSDLAEEARDTVVALSGPPTRMTMKGLAKTALRRELDRIRNALNDGKRFPPRDHDMPGGRVG